MTQHSKQPICLWKPGEQLIRSANIRRFMDWLESEKGLHFDEYSDLWEWSVNELEAFWAAIWDYFEVISPPYRSVMGEKGMPGAEWFPGAELNYAEHIFRNARTEHPAILFKSEQYDLLEISWDELRGQVASLQSWLREQGVEKGDRVVAYLPNIPEATVAFLSACSLGAVWSSCSPDFGPSSVIDRFQQIEPKILFAVDGYSYNGKTFDKQKVVAELVEALPTLEKVVFIPYLDQDATGSDIPKTVRWVDTFRASESTVLTFERVPFEHPIWVLYSSGTTGIPKAITHSHGGVLLEHLKYLNFHNDVRPGERFFWFSTTGWMMWNFVQAAFLAGATIVLYDGSPAYPDLDSLWEFAAKAKINHFGTSAPFLVANRKAGLSPGKHYDLSGLRSIGSTGSPLPPEAFDWVYQNIHKEVWLCSMAGGTDVCTAWVGGNPLLPVYQGEIQCRCLGADLDAFDPRGRSLIGEVGEMVVKQPMPSMPVYFWGDEDNRRYRSSYFDEYPGVWRHGDWVQITKRGTVIILGRSDATLNRQGVRIGTAEIYRAIDRVSEISDSIIVNLELEGGRDYMPLFIVLKQGVELSETLKKKINSTLRNTYSPRHVPDDIIPVTEIPYTISGKKMEAPLKKILMGVPVEQAATKDSMKNPGCLAEFATIREIIEERIQQN